MKYSPANFHTLDMFKLTRYIFRKDSLFSVFKIKNWFFHRKNWDLYIFFLCKSMIRWFTFWIIYFVVDIQILGIEIIDFIDEKFKWNFLRTRDVSIKFWLWSLISRIVNWLFKCMINKKSLLSFILTLFHIKNRQLSESTSNKN